MQFRVRDTPGRYDNVDYDNDNDNDAEGITSLTCLYFLFPFICGS